MSQNTAARPHLPDPSTAPELFEGLLTRRAFAYLVDVMILTCLVLAISLVGAVLGFFTFGLAWLSVLFALPLAIVAYYSVTLGSHRRATVGMQMMDIVLTPTRSRPLDGWMAVLHALVFWITIWICWPVTLLFALFTPRRQMIHDFIMGTLMVRRSPMLRHWQRMSMEDQYNV